MDIGARPYALAREGSRAVGFSGTLLMSKATGEQTSGTFGLINNLMPAEFASPYHTHFNENECFHLGEER